MPRTRIYNKYTCPCGLPFGNLRLLKSHLQKCKKQKHDKKNQDNDVHMEDRSASFTIQDIREYM